MGFDTIEINLVIIFIDSKTCGFTTQFYEYSMKYFLAGLKIARKEEDSCY